jgi:hypothetical protein
VGRKVIGMFFFFFFAGGRWSLVAGGGELRTAMAGHGGIGSYRGGLEKM